MKCLGGCCTDEESEKGAYECFKCHEPNILELNTYSVAIDLGNAQSAPSVDMVPTFTTNNDRMCLLLANGDMGMLKIEDAERLQVPLRTLAFLLLLSRWLHLAQGRRQSAGLPGWLDRGSLARAKRRCEGAS